MGGPPEHPVRSAPRRRENLPALTGARFLAALAVVLFHFGYRLRIPAPWSRIADGPAAVAFFFVLSGFVLTYNYETWFRSGVEPAKYARFLRLRIARIYPMHLVSLLLVTPLTLWAFFRHPGLVNQLTERPMTDGSLAASWLANLALVMVYVPRPSFIMPWNPPAWSIAAELFFYLLLPFILAGLGRLASRRSILFAIGALYCGQIASLVVGAKLLGLTGTGPHPWYSFNLSLYGMPPFRLWEFTIGCALGLLFLRRPGTVDDGGRKGLVTRTALIAGSFTLVAGVLLVPPIEGSLAAWGMMIRYYSLFTLPFAVIIYTLVAGPSLFDRLLRARPLVFLGEASYSFYMIHWIGLTWWNDVLYLEPAATWGLVGAMVLLSAAFHSFIEKPARSWIAGDRSRLTGAPQQGARARAATDAA